MWSPEKISFCFNLHNYVQVQFWFTQISNYNPLMDNSKIINLF